MNKNWRMETNIIRSGLSPDPQSGAISQPIVPAVAYSFPSTDAAAAVVNGDIPGTYYGRYGNPTLGVLEAKIAEMEHAEASLGVSSGMAAISTSILAYCEQGDHILVTKDIYGGTFSFLNSLAPRFGIDFSFIDCTNLKEIEESLRTNTKAIYIETPSNPILTVLDIEEISTLAKAYGLKVIVDNTFMTPYLQNPIALGADVVVHSATKYLNGHGDVIAGFIVGTEEAVQFMRKKIMGDLGQNLNAWEAFLILRGLKTLGIRMNQHCATALKVAQFLEGHPAIKKVNYPGLTSHPQHEIAKKQMRDMGGIISFEVDGGLEESKHFVDSLKLAMISFSLGDPETLIQHPASMTHSSIPESEREKYGITNGLLRLSVGLEHPDDIIDDIHRALAIAMGAKAMHNS